MAQVLIDEARGALEISLAACWQKVRRILQPGDHLVAVGGSWARPVHRLKAINMRVLAARDNLVDTIRFFGSESRPEPELE
ncbi:MAG: hypothetical protein IIA89_06190 [Chloroflexi bacterium]|nr:hypothetical protein [Chloroflexota bacterium]